MKLPLPRRVVSAILLASVSIWNIKLLNFSTAQRPSASVLRSNVSVVPGVALPLKPTTALALIVLITSRLISARISVERMLASSDSASKLWIAFRSCASSIVYSALRPRVLASTTAFSIVKPMSPKAAPVPPRTSPAPVETPVPAGSPEKAVSASSKRASVSAVVTVLGVVSL